MPYIPNFSFTYKFCGTKLAFVPQSMFEERKTSKKLDGGPRFLYGYSWGGIKKSHPIPLMEIFQIKEKFYLSKME